MKFLRKWGTIYKDEGGYSTLDKSKIDRINELARKSKTVGLSNEERIEQAALRKEYLEAVRINFKATLDSIEIK